MTDHVTQQILEAVQTALKAAATAAGNRVYLDRTDELPSGDLAAIDILGGDEAGEESIEYLTMHWPVTQRRSYSFAITSVTRAATGVAKAARNLAAQVEETLLASATAITVGGTAIDMVLGEVSEAKTGGADLPLASVRQVWQAQYITAGGAPRAAL